MDHDYIEQFDLVDRYLMGKLAAEERARFEEHFLDCPQCVDRLKTTGGFIEGLRRVTLEQIYQTEDYRSKAPLWHFSHKLSGKLWALAAICLLALAVVIFVVAANRVWLLESEINRARSESAEWQRRYEEQAASLSDKLEEEKEGETRDPEARLQSGQQQQGDAIDESGRRTQPQINAPIFVLNPVTRSDQDPAESAKEISLPRAAASFVIVLALEDETKYRDYRVTISAPDKRPILKTRGLKPNSFNSLTIRFDSTFFQPGNYVVTVEGIAGRGDWHIVGSYPLRIVKKS